RFQPRQCTAAPASDARGSTTSRTGSNSWSVRISPPTWLTSRATRHWTVTRSPSTRKRPWIRSSVFVTRPTATTSWLRRRKNGSAAEWIMRKRDRAHASEDLRRAGRSLRRRHEPIEQVLDVLGRDHPPDEPERHAIPAHEREGRHGLDAPPLRFLPPGRLFDVPAFERDLELLGDPLDERRFLVADPAPRGVKEGEVHGQRVTAIVLEPGPGGRAATGM